jgi:cytoskeleton protein RodZ
MTENTNPDSAPVATTVATTAGGLLKAARQAAGVHLAVLSVNLKVPVRQLEALEADQLPDGQSTVFARGIVASMCRQLRADPAPILALMPMPANYLEPHGAVRHAYPVPANLGRVRGASSGSPSKAWWAAVGMLVLIAALIWLPNPSQWAWFESLRAAVSAPEPDLSMPMPVATTGAATLSVAGMTNPASEPAPMAVTAVTPALPADASVAASSDLFFAAQNMSWIEVRDAQKQLVWHAVLNAGDTKRLPVALPVSVVVGRSDAVQLSVQGQPFDLKPHTQVNTARFEVKP